MKDMLGFFLFFFLILANVSSVAFKSGNVGHVMKYLSNYGTECREI